MTSNKPVGREWEGDDRSWDRILEPWRLTVHGGDHISRTFDESLMDQKPLPEPARRGWLRRLFQR